MLETQLKTRQLHPLFGQEIENISIKDEFGHELALQIRAELNRAGVILVRDQSMTDEDLLTLCSLMGEKWGQRLKAKVGTYSGDGVFQYPMSIGKAGSFQRKIRPGH